MTYTCVAKALWPTAMKIKPGVAAGSRDWPAHAQGNNAKTFNPPPPTTLVASNVFLVGENPTCSGPES